MTKDYMLPAKTEFGRGLDAHLTETVDFLATMRQSTASEINAVKFYRHHLTQLPNNVNEYEVSCTGIWLAGLRTYRREAKFQNGITKLSYNATNLSVQPSDHG